MNSTKDAYVTKKNFESRAGGSGRKNLGRLIVDPLHYRCATLINRMSTMVQASGSEHAGLGESESCPKSGKMSAKWHAKTSTRVLINSNRKACIENHVTSTDTHEQAMRHQVSKYDKTSSNYGFVRLVRRRNNPNKKTLIYIHYTSVTIV